MPYDLRSESKSALKLSLRALLLVAAASGLWHLPVQSYWLRAPILVVAVFVAIYAIAAALVSATVWRNVLAQAFGVANDRRAAAIALTGVCLAFVAALCAGAFLSVRLAIGT